MKYLVLGIVFCCCILTSYAQNDEGIKVQDTIINEVDLIEWEDKIGQFKLYPTPNTYTFLKLDTRFGTVEQVHWGNGDGTRGSETVSYEYLARGEEAVIGRFEIQTTKNIYNFLLIDTIDGRVWQLQWSYDSDKRFLIGRIY